MTTTRRRPPSRVRTATILRTERITPEMVRMVLGGDDLVDLPVGEHTDHYVKLVFPPPSAPYHTVSEFAEMRDELDSAHRPALRTYTVRRYDREAAELTIDVVTHGTSGLAGPWAARAAIGDEIWMLGPGGGYAPHTTADWHLMIGDESALPAIAASLERVPAGVPVFVFVEVENADEEQPLDTEADARIVWVHRDGGARGGRLVPAVESATLPDGAGSAFLHGEAGFVKRLRHHLRFERGIGVERLSVSGYWREGRDDEGWRSDKAAWKADVDADEHAHAAGGAGSV